MKYIALTIGPIIKTLSGAKKTQELWASSYLFSYLMKEIIRGFQKRTFVVPHVDDAVMEKTSQAGLFHDRFIFESEEGDLERLEKKVREVIAQLSSDLDVPVEYLHRYFQIHYGEYDSDTDFDSSYAHNPILGTTPYMDTMELQYHVPLNTENPLRAQLRDRSNYLKTMVYGNERAFASLPEIALADIMNDNLRNKILRSSDELDIYDDQNIKGIKSYHKYIAIVHADGDNMGKVVSNLQSGEYSDFSKKLFEYCSSSADLITDYGGKTIFAGGDDLLFFAPVYNAREHQNIFQLLQNISKVFDDKFMPYNAKLQAKGDPIATLSFGLSITYHKFPLYEALEQSRDLLFGEAKQGTKNNIAYKVIKHSGQTFGATIRKSDTEIYPLFNDLVNSFSAIDEDDDKSKLGNFLHSLHHKLHAHQVLIREACRHKDDSRLINFFDNFFKKEHKQYDIFFAAMVRYVYAVYNHHDVDDKNNLQTVYATLRFIKFLKGDKS